LGISGWLSKKKEKFLLTKTYIESEVESLEEFHIRKLNGYRRIRNASKGNDIVEFSRNSRSKPRYMKEIYKKIKKIFNNR